MLSIDFIDFVFFFLPSPAISLSLLRVSLRSRSSSELGGALGVLREERIQGRLGLDAEPEEAAGGTTSAAAAADAGAGDFSTGDDDTNDAAGEKPPPCNHKQSVSKQSHPRSPAWTQSQMNVAPWPGCGFMRICVTRFRVA